MIDISAAYDMTSYPNGSSLYVYWFGTWTSSRFSTVRTHCNSLSSTSHNQTFAFDCTCTNNAYVYPNQPYKVYLCSAFWSAPAMGRDSKAGTPVPETSHFYVVASTRDYVYGATVAHNLAVTTPKQGDQERGQPRVLRRGPVRL